jgi:hypothetical protein
MKKTLVYVMTGICLMGLTGCQTAQKLSPMQKRQITVRTIEGSYTNLFAATMSVIQDNEYVIQQASKDTGLITASVSRDSGFMNKLFSSNDYGTVSNAGTKIEVSATISKINENTSELRLSIQEKMYNNMGGVTRSSQVLDPETYQSIFNDIKVEVKRREAFGRE